MVIIILIINHNYNNLFLFLLNNLRWNSLYLMLERFLILNQSVTRVLHLKGNEKHLDKNLDEQEISDLAEVCKVLKPFFTITEKMSGEKYPTLSMILTSIEVLKKYVIL